MKCPLKFARISLVFLCSVCVYAQSGFVPTTPKLNGAVSDVRQINTASLLQEMSHASSDLVLVAAHRGYWINYPENSDPAIRAAFDNGVEVIEIDVRTTADGVLAISHDADLLKETTGVGFVSDSTWAQISSLPLRDRKGNPQANLHMLNFAQLLQILSNYQQTSGSLLGPVVIADVKDGDSWTTYLNALNVLQSTLPQAAWPAIVFKMKMRNISTDSQVGIQAQAQNHPSWGHIVATINPEDFTSPTWSPSSNNFSTVLALSQTGQNNFLQQFEMNINTVGDGATKYISGQGGQLTSFATYYESKFYPEGVSTIFGGPNDSRVFNPNPPPSGTRAGQTFCCYESSLTGSNGAQQDLRGLINFALFYGGSSHPVSLITTDNLGETFDLLVSANMRNVNKINNQ